MSSVHSRNEIAARLSSCCHFPCHVEKAAGGKPGCEEPLEERKAGPLLLLRLLGSFSILGTAIFVPAWGK